MASSTSQGHARGQTQVATPQLRQWIVEQAQAGIAPEQVLQAMRVSGWDEAVALEALETTLTVHLKDSGLASGLALDVAVPEPDLADAPTRLMAGDREVQVLLRMTLPRVVVLGGFLSDAECDELIAQASPRMARSETVATNSGHSEVNEARTSDGMFFGRAETPLCERIERRIAALLNWPIENGEGLQVLHYRPGAQYEPHHDYFDPDQPGAATVLSRGGQRVGTLVMYLNTPERGGATTFPEVGLEVAPIKGNAVFFSYASPHPATRTLHGGAPVLAGDKWVATKWMRQREFR